jgi:acyl-ACP thioesterase
MDWEKTHRDSYTIASYHADFKHSMSAVALFCFLQESAWKHAQSKGFGWEHLAQKNWFWVLAKVEAHLFYIPRWTEDIRLVTWSKEPELLTAYRDFKLYDANNRHIVSATSSWHILNMDTKKPVLITDFKDQFPSLPNDHAIEQKPEKIQLPSAIDMETDTFLVVSSDIDMNQHVNNTKYIQWAMDVLPFEFQQTHRIERICVNFLAEARIHDLCFMQVTEIDQQEFVCVIVRKYDNKILATVKTKWTEHHNINPQQTA